MAKPDFKIYKLIKSLSSAEKKIIKKALTNPVEKKLYNIIIYEIEKHNELQIIEQKAKSKYKKIFNTFPFRKAKHNLYNKIMSILRSYYVNSIYKIKSAIIDVQLLIDKNLFEEAEKIINKYINISELYEEQIISIELLNAKLHIQCVNREPLSKKLDTIKKTQQIIDRLQIIWKYMYFQSIIQHYFINELYDLNTIQKIDSVYEEFNKVFYKTPEFFSEKVLHFTFLLYYFFIKQDYKKAIDYNKKIVELFLNNKIMIERFPQSFWSYYSSLIQLFSFKGDFESTILLNNKINTLKIFNCIQYYEINLISELYTLYQKQNLQEIKSKIYNIIENFKEKENSMLFFNKVIIKWLIILLLFLIQDYDNSISMLNKLIEETKNKIGYSYFITFILFRIILHIEAKNYELVPYLIRNTYRTLKSIGKISPEIKLLIKLFKFIVKNYNNPKVVKKKIKFYKEELKKLDKGIFNFTLWFEKNIRELNKIF